MGSSTWLDGRRGIAGSDYRQIREKTRWRRRACTPPPFMEARCLADARPHAVGSGERRENCADDDGQQNDPLLHGDCPFDSIFENSPAGVTRVVAHASDVATYCPARPEGSKLAASWNL